MEYYYDRIPTDEELQTMSEEEKQQVISNYYNGYYKKFGWKPTFREKMKYKFRSLFIAVIGLIILAIIYGVINLFVVGGQKILHHNDESKMTEIKADLNSMNRTLDNYESRINNNTITDSEYDDYTRLIDKYNEEVKEYNALADKVGTTYYVVPGIR